MRDFEYFRSLYPAEAKRLLWFVEEVLDELDFDDSPIFDDYPERLFLEQLIRRAAGKAGMEPKDGLSLEAAEILTEEDRCEPAVYVAYGPGGGNCRLWETDELQIQETGHRRPWEPPEPELYPPPPRPELYPPPRPEMYPPPPRPGTVPPPNHQWDLLTVLLMHALQERRCRKERIC